MKKPSLATNAPLCLNPTRRAEESIRDEIADAEGDCGGRGLCLSEKTAKRETGEVRPHKKEQILQTPGVQTAAVRANER